MFNRNDLIEWKSINDSPPVVERILERMEDGFWLFDINDPSAKPHWRPEADLAESVAAGAVKSIPDRISAPLMRPDDAWSPAAIAHRDRWWTIIAPIVTAPNGAVFFSNRRGPLVVEAARTAPKARKDGYGIGRNEVYEKLRRYWRRGQLPNALLPDLAQCGAPGKPRVAPANAPKRGRPHDRLGEHPDRPGVNMDADATRKCLEGYELFVKKGGYSKHRAWELTRELKFGYVDDAGQWKTLPRHLSPTYEQFRYVIDHHHSKDKQARGRMTDTEFALTARPVPGNSTLMAEGPGSLYQVDATIGDIYLVGQLDRTWIIGRPVIYMVEDVYTRLITGLWVGLEGPSWVGAMMALENACRAKSDLYDAEKWPDIDIWWPAQGLPEAILTDRGAEWTGTKPDYLIDSLGIKFLTAGPYRGDMKGIIERNFGLVTHEVMDFKPGHVRKRAPGTHDHRLDARLTVDAFTELLIIEIRRHNTRWITSDRYPTSSALAHDVITGTTGMAPYQVWDRGIGRNGRLRTTTPETLRLNLLERGRGRVERDGIHFHGMIYDSPFARDLGWYSRKSRSVGIAYDRRVNHTVYLTLEQEPFTVPCTIVDTYRAYRTLDWWEIQDVVQRLENQEEDGPSLTYTDGFERQQEIIQQETAATDQALAASDLSDRARLQGTHAHRATERDQRGQSESFIQPATPQTNDDTEDHVEYVPAVDMTDLLRRLAHEGGQAS